MPVIKEAVNGRKKLRESLNPYVTKKPLQKKDKEIKNHVNWAYALHDVNHIICKQLILKDLCSLAKVNSSWREGALKEIGRRLYIQSLRLPYDSLDNSFKPAIQTLTSELKVKPHVSLLIHDNKFEKSLALDEKRIKGKLLDDFEKYLSPNMIAFKVTECLSTNDLKMQDTSNRHLGVYDSNEQSGLLDQTINGGLLGVFFPTSERQTCVRVAWEPQSNDLNLFLPSVAADRIAEKLCLEDCKDPSTLLMFVANGSCRAVSIASKLSRRVNQDNQTLWLGEVGGKLEAASNCHGQNHRSSDQIIMALRISGPSLQSWTAYINLRSPRSTVQHELHELRKKVTLKRYCSGLLGAPCRNSHGFSHEIMHDVKRICSGIPFVGMFNDHIKSPIVNNGYFEYGRQYTYLSIVIISYDD